MGARIAVLGLLVLLAACGEQAPPNEGASAGATGPVGESRGGGGSHPVAGAETLRAGRALYVQHCATCHGQDGQGAPNWHKPQADGRYPPPPLNGTGHAWHHPMAALRHTIAFGTQRIGGNMPGWNEQLSPGQIDAIIYWFQSQWPAELYEAWEELDARARGRPPDRRG